MVTKLRRSELQVVFVLGRSVLSEPEGHRREHERNILSNVGVSVVLIARFVLRYDILEYQEGL